MSLSADGSSNTQMLGQTANYPVLPTAITTHRLGSTSNDNAGRQEIEIERERERERDLAAKGYVTQRQSRKKTSEIRVQLGA